MTMGETLFLALVVCTFVAFAGVLAYFSHRNGAAPLRAAATGAPRGSADHRMPAPHAG